MNKILLPLGYCIVLISGCAGPTAGNIPTLENGEYRAPDISSKYVEAGAWLNNNRVEKLDYPDFADKKCQDRGFEKHQAYKSGPATTSSWGGLPSNDTSRTIDIWCK
jgi:hypothetical protein